MLAFSGSFGVSWFVVSIKSKSLIYYFLDNLHAAWRHFVPLPEPCSFLQIRFLIFTYFPFLKLNTVVVGLLLAYSFMLFPPSGFPLFKKAFSKKKGKKDLKKRAFPLYILCPISGSYSITGTNTSWTTGEWRSCQWIREKNQLSK